MAISDELRKQVDPNNESCCEHCLSSKCKEWILNQKNKDCFYIADQFSLNIESQMGVIKYFWCVLLKNNSRVSPEFKADSELEAVIKASEYILKEINENR